MENRATFISAQGNKEVKMSIIPGHFATNHSHVSHYIDLTGLKCQPKMAMAAAKELARSLAGTAKLDTIICLEGTEIIGAYLAQELSGAYELSILTPELNTNNQMIFRDNLQKMVWGKNVLLLMASVSTGKTINRAVDCLRYYNGHLAGVAALFSAVQEMDGTKVHAVFTDEDLHDYHTYAASDCAMCRSGRKLDAIINSFGYSKI